MNKHLKRFLDYWSLFMTDHGILRLLYRNCHRLPGGLFRTNQPDPKFLRYMVGRHGIRTVISLRGENDQHGWHRLETEECHKLGVTFKTATVYSRGLLTSAEILTLKQMIISAELPALVHCKSGADRAGYFSMLYRHFRLGEPIDTARQELSVRYGHFKGAKTGVLDHQVASFSKNRGIRQSFQDWISRDYCRTGVQRSFRPWSIVSWLVDVVLKRE